MVANIVSLKLSVKQSDIVAFYVLVTFFFLPSKYSSYRDESLHLCFWIREFMKVDTMTYFWLWREQTGVLSRSKSVCLGTVTEPPRMGSIVLTTALFPKQSSIPRRTSPKQAQAGEPCSVIQNCHHLGQSWILKYTLKWLYGGCPALLSKWGFPLYSVFWVT